MPVQQKAIPEIRIEQGHAPAIPAADQVKIPVKSLHVTGQTLYSEAELVAVTGFSPGGELTLSELRGMASKIADHYHRNGYFVAQAYLPAQDIKDGAVTIAVIEGRYGSVTLRNQTNLSDNLANSILGGLNKGDVIASLRLSTAFFCFPTFPAWTSNRPWFPVPPWAHLTWSLMSRRGGASRGKSMPTTPATVTPAVTA